MADYARLLDEETRDFIRRTESFCPPGAADLTVAGQRRAYDRMCRAFGRGRPEGVKVRDDSARGVPVRIYEAGLPSRTVMYFHGGGFVLGGLDSHDDICAEICARTGFRVVSVDYRLAPEHPHPAAFDDCRTATLWAARQYGGGLVLAGDSAGGTLAAAVAHHWRGQVEGILGQVLIYPGLGGDISGGSFIEHAQAPMLSRDDVIFYRDIRLAGQEPTDDPTWAPLQARDFSGLPPTVVFVAECDPLRDDGHEYCRRLREAGVRARCVEEKGLVHGYLRARGSVTRARESFGRIEVAIEALGQGLWPRG